MIRYLRQEEKIRTRKLWESIFTEDGLSFVDFYYTDKIKKNKILVEEEAGEPVAMIHRNPFDMVMREQVFKVDYIAGVATREDKRHQGCMSRLLSRAFADMYMERMPFCFLLPVSQAIYRPFEFVPIFNKQPCELSRMGQDMLSSRACTEQREDCREAAAFAGRLLESQYDIYVLRDEEYYKSLCREVRSGEGDLIFLRTKDETQALVGIQAYYGGPRIEEREFLCLPQYQREAGPAKPMYMGRIIHLEQFLESIHLNSGSALNELELVMQVKDGHIRQNDGLFLWRLNKSGSEAVRLREGERKPCFTIGIDSLTSWLFGYEKPNVMSGWQKKLENVEVYSKIFFDEVV